MAYPFGIAPTGFTRMMHTEGERAGAAAAGAAGIPFSLSTVGTTSIEDVNAANPSGRNWFQLYMWRDRERSMALLDRAAACDYDTLLITVDVPVGGARLRDKRNGLTIPPSITAATVLNAIPRPGWWINFLTTEPLTFSSFDRWDGTVAELMDTMFDPTVSYDDLAWIIDHWPNKVIVKGVQTLEDAKKVASMGVDAVLLSNHGGRQLDRAPIPFHLLPEVVREIGSDVEIHVDTGIMSGADVVACVALGARMTLVGRAYLYGLMAGGRAEWIGRSRSSPTRSNEPCDSLESPAWRNSHPGTSRSCADSGPLAKAPNRVGRPVCRPVDYADVATEFSIGVSVVGSISPLARNTTLPLASRRTKYGYTESP